MREGEKGRFPARVEFYEEALSDTALDWRLAATEFFRDKGVSAPFEADQHGYTIGFETKEDRRLLYEFLAAHGDEEIRLAGPSQNAAGFGPVLDGDESDEPTDEEIEALALNAYDPNKLTQEEIEALEATDRIDEIDRMRDRSLDLEP